MREKVRRENRSKVLFSACNEISETMFSLPCPFFRRLEYRDGLSVRRNHSDIVRLQTYVSQPWVPPKGLTSLFYLARV